MNIDGTYSIIISQNKKVLFIIVIVLTSSHYRTFDRIQKITESGKFDSYASHIACGGLKILRLVGPHKLETS